MPATLVTGGTGTLGRLVVRRLLDAGRDVRVLSRRPLTTPGTDWVTGDLVTGQGLDTAVAGAEAIVHCASDSRHPRSDIEAARRLIAAARSGDAPHLVYISIVGVDRVPLGYYRAKLQVERLVEACGLPWTILRATQFHDFVLMLLRPLTRLPIVPVPAGTSVQPIDADEVAERLVALAAGEPQGRVADMGGPQIRAVDDLMRAYLLNAGRRRPLLPVPLPGRVAAAYRRGGHLAPDHAVGRRTWEEFLAARGGRRRD